VASLADEVGVTASTPGGYGTWKTVMLALVVLPLFAVPLYFLGQGMAGSLDDDRTDGVLALGLILGVGLPGIMSTVLARWWGDLHWVAAVVLGVGSGFIAVGVLFATFLAVCTATTCVV
jgi:hypothetical protein